MSIVLGSQQLADLSERRFEKRLGQLLVSHAAGAKGVVDTTEGQRALRKQCAAARGYGMTAELDVSRYVIVAWMMGVDFDKRIPAMAEILSAVRLTPTQKSEAIERVCTAVLNSLHEGQA